MSEERSDSQCAEILRHLERGQSITAIEALDLYYTFRLAARIAELRGQGHQIDTIMHKFPSGKRVASYVLVRRRAA